MKDQILHLSAQQTTRFPVGVLVALLVVVLFSAIAPHSTAQAPQDNRQLKREQAQPSNSASERRIALVIGNGTYTNAPPLKNPPNDARDMVATPKTLGFEVASAAKCQTLVTGSGYKKHVPFSRYLSMGTIPLFNGWWREAGDLLIKISRSAIGRAPANSLV